MNPMQAPNVGVGGEDHGGRPQGFVIADFGIYRARAGKGGTPRSAVYFTSLFSDEEMREYGRAGGNAWGRYERDEVEERWYKIAIEKAKPFGGKPFDTQMDYGIVFKGNFTVVIGIVNEIRSKSLKEY